MASKQAQLADAVTADLNQDPQPWPLALTAVRTWRAQWTLIALANLQVAVTPGPAEYERVTRATVRATFATDIILAKRVDPAVNSQVDAIAELAESVAEWFAATYAAAEQTVGSSTAKLARAPEFVSPAEAAVDSKLLTDDRTAVIALRLTWWMYL